MTSHTPGLNVIRGAWVEDARAGPNGVSDDAPDFILIAPAGRRRIEMLRFRITNTRLSPTTLRDSSRLRVFVVDWGKLYHEGAKTRRNAK